MKIREILEDATTTPPQPTGSLIQLPASPTRKYQSIDTLAKDPDALVNTWAPRIAQLQARANAMLARLVKAAGPQYARQLAGTTVAVRSTEEYAQATVDQRVVTLDITVFWDAPDATLAVAIGHELGHIAFGHNYPVTPAQSRKEEFSADDFGIRLAKSLGYNTAELFNFMHDKEEYNFTNAISKMSNSTHPSYDQRIERAKKQGFKLSKGGQQQIDALQQHLA
jgi:predicted Zn-dependent protease